MATSEQGNQNGQYIHRIALPYRIQYEKPRTVAYPAEGSSYLGIPCGIARTNAMKALQVGGYDDHIHILLAMPPSMPISKAVQLLKGASSRWIHETDNDMAAFAWQDGYGAFTVGVSQIADTVRYIEGQREHHRTKSFQEEYVHFLRKHGVEYDERYVWG